MECSIDNSAYIIGLTGGIGAGKSVVARILRCKGFEVYDCDFEARNIMESYDQIISSIRDRFGEMCYDSDGRLNRKYLAEKIFSSDDDRRWINAMVHDAVRRDIEEWSWNKEIVFVESAILHTSRLDAFCDRIWIVDADDDLRLTRAIRRGGIGRDNILARMESQKREMEGLPSEKISRIDNDGRKPLLSQIDNLLKTLIKQ